MEAAALRLALERNRSRLIDGLAEVCAGMEKARAAGDEPAYLRLDSAFHEQFFANCGNRYFAEGYARIVPKVAALRTHLATRPDHTRMSYEEHKQILQSIQRKRDKELIPILDKHIERTRSAYTHGISRTSRPRIGSRRDRRDFRRSGRGDDRQYRPLEQAASPERPASNWPASVKPLAACPR